MRGRGGRGALARGRGSDGYWPQGPHSNKMSSRGGFGGPSRGGRGGLLGLPGPGGRGGGSGLGKPYPYPMPGSDLALEFGGGYEKSGNGENKMNSEDGKTLLNEYYSMMFESYTRYQTQLFETGQFSDFTIQCEGTEFKVHRLVLGPKSPVLMKVMSDTPSPMLIRDVDCGTLQVETTQYSLIVLDKTIIFYLDIAELHVQWQSGSGWHQSSKDHEITHSCRSLSGT